MIVSRQQVEFRSYLIWEQEGRPNGRDWDHWFRAEAELARDRARIEKAAAQPSGQPREPQGQRSRSTRKPAAKKT